MSLKELLQKGVQKSVEESSVPLGVHIRALGAISRRLKESDELHKTSEEKIGKHLKTHEEEYGRLMSRYEQEIERISNLKRGDKGYRGDSGKDGADGKNGISPSIKEIVDRVISLIPAPIDGKPGRDAKEVDIEDILRLVIEKIQKEKLIDISHIRNFQTFLKGKTKYKIEELMHGGGGTSTGGGFTTLAATETPNGVITAFTFATATAKPSYIVADNVWLKPVSKAGTTNWTWLGTVATLTIPPNDDVWAVK